MGWLIALGVIAALAVLPLGIYAAYDASGAVVKLFLGPVKVQVYPGKKKTEEKHQKPDKSKSSKPETKKNQGGPLVKLVLAFLTELRRKLRVRRLEMNIILAGDDPCDLATNYGRAWTALGNLWPQLEELFIIQKRDVKLQCDFEAEQTLVIARLDIRIALGSLLVLGGLHGVRILKKFYTISKQRKGGATI